MPRRGRENRMAARVSGADVLTPPVYGGMKGGAYKPMTEDQMQRVLDTALDLLEEVGMGGPVPEFIEVVTDAGGWMDEHGRLHFPRKVVEQIIDTATKEWVWHGFDESLSAEMGGEKVHFSTAGAAVLRLDHESQEFKFPSARDIYDSARLADTLEHIHIYLRTIVARDMVESRDLDLMTAYAVMMGTSKPSGTSFFRPEHVHEAVAMFDMAMGGEGEFRKRPFMTANATFVVPPMQFAYETAECMVAQVETGFPINLLSAGQAGATSPATLAGSLVQALAECLSALTCVNLLNAGHPCLMGMWPFVSDLRTGAMTGGSGEEAVLNAAAAQLLNWMGLPSSVAAGMADSKIPDAQAGHEKALTVALAAHAGANVVYESAGMLGSLLVYSHEMMVIDNDMLGAINRTIRGVDVSDDTLAKEVIRDTIFGAGHFLGSDQTLSVMQSEYIYPAVGDRQNPSDWQEAGSKDAKDRAHEIVRQTLSTHFPTHVSHETDDKIRATFDIKIPIEHTRA
ncbi:MAG: trimethylamine methyltransferase family protein [Acidimicrobiia bacterium]|nr:trimethylamine methyltransferase family protein [Acidimicrobiia bacterium]MDH5420924.1 trimethylamine methyltransferase family protein [Acidimicrobiia bacterium]MDH5504391.1 trimethylamine methyltransferase family protein [Acidimicrobiia bacterium]